MFSMKWDLEKIDEIVEFINTELALGRTMKDIEKEDFGVNSRVIHKRLERQRYKKRNNQYICEKYVGQPVCHDVRQGDLKEKVVKENKGLLIADFVTEPNNSKKLIDILNNYDKIMKLLDEREKYKKVITAADRLVIRLPNEEGKKDFRITVRVNKKIMERFNIFADKHKMFTKKELISQALLEFLEKYDENDFE